jgi:hypothetical protein
MPQNAVPKVPDISRAFPQVLVVGGFERSGDLLDGGLDGPFGVDLLPVDGVADPLAELLVTQPSSGGTT